MTKNSRVIIILTLCLLTVGCFGTIKKEDIVINDTVCSPCIQKTCPSCPSCVQKTCPKYIQKTCPSCNCTEKYINTLFELYYSQNITNCDNNKRSLIKIAEGIRRIEGSINGNVSCVINETNKIIKMK